MIKECKVLLNNSAVTVVRFCDRDVQLPPIGRKANTVFIRFENGRYEIVDGNNVFKNNEDEKIVFKNNSEENIVFKNNVNIEQSPKAKRQRRKKPVEEVEE